MAPITRSRGTAKKTNEPSNDPQTSDAQPSLSTVPKSARKAKSAAKSVKTSVTKTTRSKTSTDDDKSPARSISDSNRDSLSQDRDLDGHMHFALHMTSQTDTEAEAESKATPMQDKRVTRVQAKTRSATKDTVVSEAKASAGRRKTKKMVAEESDAADRPIATTAEKRTKTRTTKSVLKTKQVKTKSSEVESDADGENESPDEAPVELVKTKVTRKAAIKKVHNIASEEGTPRSLKARHTHAKSKEVVAEQCDFSDESILETETSAAKDAKTAFEIKKTISAGKSVGETSKMTKIASKSMPESEKLPAITRDLLKSISDCESEVEPPTPVVVDKVPSKPLSKRTTRIKQIQAPTRIQSPRKAKRKEPEVVSAIVDCDEQTAASVQHVQPMEKLKAAKKAQEIDESTDSEDRDDHSDVKAVTARSLRNKKALALTPRPSTPRSVKTRTMAAAESSVKRKPMAQLQVATAGDRHKSPSKRSPIKNCLPTKGFIKKKLDSVVKIAHFNLNKNTASDRNSTIIPKRRLYAFGHGPNGEIGFESCMNAEIAPQLIRLPIDVMRAVSQANHNALIAKDGTLYTFGCNQHGQLGRNTKSFPSPYYFESKCLPILEADQVRHVSTGQSCTFWIDQRNRLFGVGAFQLDDQSTIPITGLQDADQFHRSQIEGEYKSVECGLNFVVAIDRTNRVRTFGVGQRGQLGRLKAVSCAFQTKHLLPQLVQFDSNKDSDEKEDDGDRSLQSIENGLNYCVKSVWAGYDSAFAVLQDDRVFAWGDNRKRQLALGSVDGDSDFVYKPKEVTFFVKNNIKVDKIAIGQNHTLVLDTSGRLYSFGSNEYGQVGSNCAYGSAQIRAALPMLVDSFCNETVVDIACGKLNSYAVTKKGDLYSWGLSDWQIGIQSVLGHSLNFMGPQKVVNETEWKNRKVLNVKAGSSHVLVITN